VPAVGLIVGGGALTLLLLAAGGLTARTAYRAVAGGSERTAAEAGNAADATPAPTTDTEVTTEPSTAPAEPAAAKPAAAGDEATVLLDLGDLLLAQHKDAGVPALVARLIAREPARKDDPRVGKILLAAAASSDRKAAADSHALLTGLHRSDCAARNYVNRGGYRPIDVRCGDKSETRR
jgi:hypothetical protein